MYTSYLSGIQRIFDKILNEIHNFGPKDVHPPPNLDGSKVLLAQYGGETIHNHVYPLLTKLECCH